MSLKPKEQHSSTDKEIHESVGDGDDFEEEEEEEEKDDLKNIVDFDFNEADEARAERKLIIASSKYDPNSSSCLALTGFDCKELRYREFRELTRRIFGLKLSAKEMGAMCRRFDVDLKGVILCQHFLTEFLGLGMKYRRKVELKQIKMNKAAEEKIKDELEKKANDLDNRGVKALLGKGMKSVAELKYTDKDSKSALAKLLDGSLRFEKARGANLNAFEAATMKPGFFAEALRSTFGVHLTGPEVMAVIALHDKDRNLELNCASFLVWFIKLGVDEKFRISSERIRIQREQAQKQKEADAKKMKAALMNSVIGTDSERRYEINFGFTDDDRTAALAKLTECAYQYPPDAPRFAVDAQYLDSNQFCGFLMKKLQLRLNPSELGALVKYFDKNGDFTVYCPDFVNLFNKLSFEHKALEHKQEFEKIRIEQQKQREAQHLKELDEIQSNLSFLVPFSERDEMKALRKIIHCAEKFDRHHPSAPSLAEFDNGIFLGPKLFRSNLKKIFRLKLSAPELSYVIQDFCRNPVDFAKIESLRVDKDAKKGKKGPGVPSQPAPSPAPVSRKKSPGKRSVSPAGSSTVNAADAADITARKKGLVSCGDFLNKFLAVGVNERNVATAKQLEKQRLLDKAAREAEEKKIKAVVERTDGTVIVDREFSRSDRVSAYEQLEAVAEKYNKNSPSAPSLRAFEFGNLTPGVFRDQLKTCFNLHFTPKELGALMADFLADNGVDLNPRLFLVAFIKMGVTARAKTKAIIMENQRRAELAAEAERERRKKILSQKSIVDIDNDFGAQDRTSALEKMTEAAARYDKNAPGCVSMDVFSVARMTAMEFREAMKNTFGIYLVPKELGALVREFDEDKCSMVNCQAFVRTFLRMGADKKEKDKAIQMEKQRHLNFLRKTEHDRKMNELNDKIVVNIKYNFKDQHEIAAFNKLAVVAVKYDRSHPGTVSLDGFDASYVIPSQFKELLKKTFNLKLRPHELGAMVKYFEIPSETSNKSIVNEDGDNSVLVDCKAFLTHFFQLGVNGRSRDFKKQIAKQREENAARERAQIEKLASQWAKSDIDVDWNFSNQDLESALSRLYDAAEYFDPVNPGPVGLKAFKSSDMSPGVFREMLKRSFELKMTNTELGALVKHFDVKGNNMVDGSRFVAEFCRVGCLRREQKRKEILQKNKEHAEKATADAKKKEELAGQKVSSVSVDYNFTRHDFKRAISYIRGGAKLFNPTHTSSFSLSAFSGSNMTAAVFRDIFCRTFKHALNAKELGALLKFFDPKGAGVIEVKEFLNYFHKLHREEAERENKRRLEAERKAEMAETLRFEALKKAEHEAEVERLKFTHQDELSCLEKLRAAAKMYIASSSSFSGAMAGVKEAGMAASFFRNSFNGIFLIKFTMSEIGALLHYIDGSGGILVDGPSFMKAFLKLIRIEELVTEAELESDQVTMELLRPGAAIPIDSSTAETPEEPAVAERDYTGKKIEKKASPSPSRSRSKSKRRRRSPKKSPNRSASPPHSPITNKTGKIVYTAAEKPHFSRKRGGSINRASPTQAFNQSTLQNSWILPPLAGSSVASSDVMEHVTVVDSIMNEFLPYQPSQIKYGVDDLSLSSSVVDLRSGANLVSKSGSVVGSLSAEDRGRSRTRQPKLHHSSSLPQITLYTPQFSGNSRNNSPDDTATRTKADSMLNSFDFDFKGKMTKNVKPPQPQKKIAANRAPVVENFEKKPIKQTLGKLTVLGVPREYKNMEGETGNTVMKEEQDFLPLRKLLSEPITLSSQPKKSSKKLSPLKSLLLEIDKGKYISNSLNESSVMSTVTMFTAPGSSASISGSRSGSVRSKVPSVALGGSANAGSVMKSKRKKPISVGAPSNNSFPGGFLFPALLQPVDAEGGMEGVVPMEAHVSDTE